MGGWTAAVREAGDSYISPILSGPLEYSQESETIAVTNTFIWEGGWSAQKKKEIASEKKAGKVLKESQEIFLSLLDSQILKQILM